MSISIASFGANAVGSTSLTANYPAGGVVEGKLSILMVVNKGPNYPTTPTGYTLIDQVEGGSAGSGEDDGPTRTSTYYRILDGGESSVPVTITDGNASAGRIAVYTKGSADTWVTPVAAIAVDTSHDTSMSFSYDDTLDFNNGDRAYVVFGLANNLTNISNISLTATGATFAVFSNSFLGGTSTGDNIQSRGLDYPVTGGPATAAALFTATASVNTSGTSQILLIRVLTELSDADTITITESEDLEAQLDDSDTITITESEDLAVSLSDSDTITITESEIGLIESMTVVFNNNANAPGFNINITLIDPNQVTMVTVFRRDPSGLYPDSPVRGLDRIETSGPDLYGEDYEAPLGVTLDYYVHLISADEGTFLFGPIVPTPTAFIPTMSNSYGEGVAYIKHVEQPGLSRAVMIQSFDGYSRKTRILAEHDVLDRQGPVIITDRMGLRSGTFRINCWLQEGQSHYQIEELFADGTPLLLQNNNPVVSGIRDMFFHANGFQVIRHNRMAHLGLMDGPVPIETLITVEIGFIERGRPATEGVEVTIGTWQDVLDNLVTWQAVLDNRTSWLDVLRRATEGP